MSIRIRPERLKAEFEQIRREVSRKFSKLKNIRLEHCKTLDREHEITKRAYMHVEHRGGIICYCKAATLLPVRNICGLLWHEFGHLISGRASDAVADLRVLGEFGIKMKYDDKEIEYV